jgi:uncharacterized protein YfaS (alpha-2-macroglobulin family)
VQGAETKIQGLFASARVTDANGVEDMSFVLSSWNQGIESFRFNFPTDFSPVSTKRAHTIFDRPLFRAGQTVSMKHVFRSESRNGFGNVNPKDLPVKVRIVHQGSGQEYVFPLQWRGNQSALTQFAIPQQAKLGTYEVYLEGLPPTEKRPEYEEWGLPSGTYLTGSFRVEEFVLPTMTGQITQSAGLLVQPKQIPLQLQLNYLNGGAAAGRRLKSVRYCRGVRCNTVSLKIFSSVAGVTVKTVWSSQINRPSVWIKLVPVKHWSTPYLKSPARNCCKQK